MKFLLVALVVLYLTEFSVQSSVASQLGPVEASGISELGQDVEATVNDVMRCRRMPGMTVAVYRDQLPPVTAVYGKRELFLPDNDPRARATPDTRFCIGSLTKAFTSTLISQLLAESNGSVTWDTTLRELFGNQFRLVDVWRSTKTTIRDLLAHKIGFAQYPGAWIMGWDPTKPREDYCSRLYHIHGQFDFRQQFYYSNFGYMLAACVVERLAGKPYVTVIKERLFDPLGMNSTEFPMTGNDWSKYAVSYVWVPEENNYRQMYHVIVEDFRPAEGSGGLCSTADDMIKWLRFQLNNGKVGDRQVVASEFLINTLQHQMAIEPELRRTYFPQYPIPMDASTYGFGWNIGHYRGFLRHDHAGTLSGYSSQITMYPDKKVGIFTAVNGPMHNDAYNGQLALHHYLSDVILGLNPWLNNQTLCSFPELGNNTASQQEPMKEESTEDHGKDEQIAQWYKKLHMSRTEQKQNTQSSNWQPYVGTYGHPLFGNITVFYNTTIGRLQFMGGKHGTGFLNQVGNDMGNLFLVEFTGACWYFFNTGPAKGTTVPIEFTERRGNIFNALLAYGYEPSFPPTFRRGVLWNQPPTTGKGTNLSYPALAVLITSLFSLLHTCRF